ncbi:MAG: hypothetical protein WC444_05165 [Candidatus Paceibacterota bacterium]
MAAIKSIQTMFAELKTYLRARSKYLDLSDNSLLNELILKSFSVGGKLIMDQVNKFKNLHILSLTTGSDLEDEAGNYLLEKLSGNYAKVILTLWTNTKPTSNVVIPISTQAKTSGTAFVSPVTFSTLSELNVPVSAVDSYFSFDRNRYEFNVLAQCDSIGSVGIVGSNLVNELITSVSQIDSVTNLRASYGNNLDSESDSGLQERIRLARVGRNKNVLNGIKKTMKDLGFFDANVVRPGDTYSEKATGIDTFVVDTSSEKAEDVFVYDPSNVRYYFTHRPILEVTSVVSEINGALVASQYSVTIDSDSPVRRSVDALDYIEFLPPVSLVPGSRITVVYNYASAIKNAQDIINLDNSKVLTSNVLVKRAYPLYLYLNAQLTLKANADGPTTRNKCKNALAQFMSTYILGQPLQESDLIVTLQLGYGDYPIDTVDAVRISQFYLQDEYGNNYPSVNGVISLNKKQHAVYGSTSIV